jgi:anaerobic selenocysteine-containing dehydrogenase
MDQEDEQVVKSICRMCHGVCGVQVHMRNGRVERITGDPAHPMSNGFICSKGAASVEYLYHPDRLRHPLKRTGAKGENKWERITWDEALDTVSKKLLAYRQEFGPESVAVAIGTGRPYQTFALRFANSFGTPNIVGYAHVCYLPRVLASMLTCGQLPVCDFYGFGGMQPQCIMVWGCNISETGAADGMCGHQLALARRRGARSIVIDPRRTGIASKADIWAQIRPGTDVALALSMMNVIIEEGLYDKEFVEKYTNGFDQLIERVKKYPPSRAAEITWIPAETIKDMARLYATTKPACLLWGNGIDQSANCFQTARALLILRALTGNIDVPGGDVFWVPPEGVFQTSPFMDPSVILPDRVAPEAMARKLGAGESLMNLVLRHSVFYDAVLTEKPYPMKALVLVGTNPLLTASDSLKGEEALKKLEFTVALDLFMNPTNQFADIILPAATWLEQDDVADLHFIWCVCARKKLAEVGECWDDKKIFLELAKRMGLEDAFPWKNVREWCDFVLKDAGLDFDEFKRRGILEGKMRYRKFETDGFATPSGKFEIALHLLEMQGGDPIPDFIEPPESPYSAPELAKEYPLIAITGCKIEPFFHTEYRQLESQRKRNPEPLVEIHPETAAGLGIEDGDWVWIESPRARIRQKAKLTSSVHPRMVAIQHAWWFPEKQPPEYGWKESSANLLLAPRPVDPIWGSESWKGFLCRLYKQ